MKRITVCTILLILAGLLTACVTAGTPSVDDIVARLQAAQEQQQNMHAVVEMTVTLPEGDQPPMEMVAEQWVKGPDKMRAEYLEAPESMAGTIMVLNAQHLWTYHPDRNTYTEVALSDLEGLTPSPEEIVAQMRTMVGQVLETMDVTYLGREEVAGRPAYKLRAAPKPGQTEPTPFGTITEATLWVDLETWQLLGMEMATGEMGQRSWVYREIEYNPDLPDDLFTFVPPEGAQRVEAETSQMQMMTLEEARQAVDFPVLAPAEVPEGYELQGVRVMEMPAGPSVEGGQQGVMLMYRSATNILTISQLPIPEMPQRSGERVTVRGHSGVLREAGFGGRMLGWTENGVQITIAGQLSAEELLAVAESLQ